MNFHLLLGNLVHPADYFTNLFGTDNLVLQALQVMGYGVTAVFIVLAVFYGIITAMKKIWPRGEVD